MDIKILCWNVQGCGDIHFLPAAKQFLQDNKHDVVVFVELRIRGRRANSIISSLGFPNSHRVEANGFAGGIWVAWYDTVSITIAITHFQFIHFCIMNKRDRSSLLATMVYVSPSASGKKLLWPHLCRLASSIRGPWILFGDFNATLCSADRHGCASSVRPNKAFQNLIFDNGLRDMGFHGPEFTRSKGSASARLDRFICNSYFDEAFHVALVHHLLRMRSDHRPIMLEIGNVSRQSGAGPFRYFSWWLSHEDFLRMVEDNWSPGASMTETICSFISAAYTWNKIMFGYLGTNKRMIMARLRGIQRTLYHRPSRFLFNLEADLLIELEHLLDQEEVLWRQKSRSDWISHSDRNTRYFHRCAIARRQRNRVTSLKLMDGSWCDDESKLKEEEACFFRSLFADNDNAPCSFPITGSFPNIPHELMRSLDSIPSSNEIHSALMDMAPLKSAAPTRPVNPNPLHWQRPSIGWNAEAIEIEREKRVVHLRKLEVKRADYMKTEKTKKEVEKLESQMMVALQAIETTSAEIIKLRELELYPQLIEVVKGQSTHQLELEVQQWHLSFCNLVKAQRDYIQSLSGWLRLSHFQFSKNPILRNSQESKIYAFYEEWHLAIDKILNKVASEGIKSFLTVIHAIVVQQAEEYKQKKKADSACKDFENKDAELISLESKYSPFSMPETNKDLVA
ncbi:hypothetical protein V6N13_053185 [Hibiscus sabdariffa]